MSRFEIVRSDAPQQWHARFRAANGRIVWTTEQYHRRAAALNAIVAFTREFGVPWPPLGIRDVDERGL